MTQFDSGYLRGPPGAPGGKPGAPKPASTVSIRIREAGLVDTYEEHPEVQAPEVPAALAAHLSPRNLEEEHPGNHLAAVEGIDSRIPPAVVEPALQLPPPGPSDQPASHVQQAC